jgi:hypothetical protein
VRRRSNILERDDGEDRDHEVSTVRVCAHCGAELEYVRGIGWVDSLSGAKGGTYATCKNNPKGHRPVETT